MRSIKVQYFLAFAVFGSVFPYLPIFLAQRGLSDVDNRVANRDAVVSSCDLRSELDLWTRG